MARKLGAGNIKAFDKTISVATTDGQEIRHLARQFGLTPITQFDAQLRNQRSYLAWIDSRHSELLDAKRQLNPNGRGPKDAIYRKYRWYAEQQSLLEAINGFEVFYKSTFIELSRAIRRYVPAQKIKGSVDARVLWVSQGSASFMSLIFEHQLFHNLETIDDMTAMLVGARRYMPNNTNNPLRQRVRAIQCAFQIRHTLSHNQGRVTQSDKAKFASFGYEATHSEVIDPSKDYLGISIRDLLLLEAKEFTEWLLQKTADFLSEQNRNAGVILKEKTRQRIERLLGIHPAITALPWQ